MQGGGWLARAIVFADLLFYSPPACGRGWGWALLLLPLNFICLAKEQEEEVPTPDPSRKREGDKVTILRKCDCPVAGIDVAGWRNGRQAL